MITVVGADVRKMAPWEIPLVITSTSRRVFRTDSLLVVARVDQPTSRPLLTMDTQTYPGKGLSLPQLIFALNAELKNMACSPL